MSVYHQPVMLTESIEGLNIKPEGVYVDVTFGGGGHAAAIAAKLKTGKLFGFDQDKAAQMNIDKIIQSTFTLIPANFRHMKKYLKAYGVNKVDGVLADLGISSYQIDTPERGFSTRFEATLDMRMNQESPLTAGAIIDQYEEGQLQKVFSQYGEVRNAKTLASSIVRERAVEPIRTIDRLKSILTKLAPRGRHNKYFAQVFQALRIEVNDELKALQELLLQCSYVVAKGGRLVVISYHSLEDRLVKNFMNNGNFFEGPVKDFYGNQERPFRPVIRKPIRATAAEIADNSRARSAKLRIAEKL
ncbi:MAG: 16S rRNA (cytosine(1402)-N(4))-methyltransferase RsmH [Cyclobacteriaceae bacterium]